jgi:S1-C subfamily serine protease
MSSRIKATLMPSVAALVFGAAVGFGAAGTTHTVQGQSAVDPVTQELHTVYGQDNPSVVTLNVRIPASANGFNGFNAPSQGAYQYAAGSGFVYDTNGDIVTNAHVVDGANQIEITFADNTMMYGKVVGVDYDSDIAVVKAQGDASKYQPLTLADSDTLQIGDRAIAIGNPFENSGTMTQGIVSGLNRLVQGLGQYSIPDAIQTDAAINPGNSGGPLLNVNGQVIGVNEQIASQVRQSSGVSFAIPSNIVKMVADTLIKSGSMQHTYLGVTGGTTTLETNHAMNLPDNTHGALITTVQRGSPAATAGLRGGNANNTVDVEGQNTPVGGDIVVAIDGHPIAHFEDLTAYLFTKTAVGQTITLTVLRNGSQQDIKVTLGARPVSTGTNG